MSETQPEIFVDEPPPPPANATVWRFGVGGTIMSVSEHHCADLAEREFPNAIYFYADLGDSQEVTHNGDTIEKIYRALAAQGLSEGQIINAVNAMQNVGIVFRERAI